MPKIVIDKELCKFCGMCAAACPKKLIVPGKGLNRTGSRYMIQVREEDCVGCKFCGVMCPDSAISVYR